jgi:hypothetical protein
MNNHTNFLAMVSTEFQKYLMEHETIADKIPFNALIIFQIEGEDDFNNWHNVESGIIAGTFNLKRLKEKTQIYPKKSIDCQ